MPGFMNSDGSALIGGELPNGAGKSLQLDTLGNLLVNVASTQAGSADGAGLNTLIEEAIGLYTSGGPVQANGTPTQLTFDRLRTWLGKGSQQQSITATLIGDSNLVFATAPKTIMPGQLIKLSGAATPEYVYVSSSYSVSSSALSIPLQAPVVNAGQNQAQWDVFNPAGPATGAVTPAGTLLSVGLVLDSATGNLYAQQGLRGVTDVSVGGRSSLAIAAAVSANTVVKASPGRLARVLVTALGTGALSIYDNASSPTGTIIGLVPASAPVGTLLDCQAPAANGLTVAGNSANPGVTIFYY